MLMAARNLPGALRFVAALDAMRRRHGRACRGRQEGLTPASSSPATRWASSAWARSAAWWPTPRSSSACRCWATTPTSRSTRRGACRRRSGARPAWPRCSRTATSSRCTCRWSPRRKNLVNADNIGTMKAGAVLLNFSREGVVDNAAVLAALQSKQLGWYVCDFPHGAINGHERVLALPHLGASTREAEENCALMVVDQLRDFPRARQRGALGQLPRRGDAARVALAGGDRQRQRAQHAGPDVDRDGAGRPEHPQHGQQEPRRGGLHPGRRGQRGAAGGAGNSCAAIQGVLSVRYLPSA